MPKTAAAAAAQAEWVTQNETLGARHHQATKRERNGEEKRGPAPLTVTVKQSRATK